jgi:hypothetical protein
VLVPVKAFGEAKRRLHQAMTGPERAELARAMADRVLAAAHPLPLAVVCDDVDVAEWARAWGALVVWEPGRGLNGAVEAGVAHLGHAGVVQVTVAHADLPHATDLETAPTSSPCPQMPVSSSPMDRAPSPGTGPRPSVWVSPGRCCTVLIWPTTWTNPATSSRWPRRDPRRCDGA